MGYLIIYDDADDEECILCYDDNKYTYEWMINTVMKSEQDFNALELDFFGDYLMETLPSDIHVVKSYDIGTYHLG